MPSIVLGSIFGRSSFVINHDEKFPNLSGHYYFDISKYEPNMMRPVEPAPISTLTEVLHDHVKSHEQSFASNLRNTVAGSRVMMGLSYGDRAAQDCLVLMHDYLPANMADAAAALYLFKVKNCKIRNTGSKMPAGMNACQYNGAKILADIARRLQTINAIKLVERNLGIPDQRKPVKVLQSAAFKALEQQARQMYLLFGSNDYEGYLANVDQNMYKVWNELKTLISS